MLRVLQQIVSLSVKNSINVSKLMFRVDLLYKKVMVLIRQVSPDHIGS